MGLCRIPTWTSTHHWKHLLLTEVLNGLKMVNHPTIHRNLMVPSSCSNLQRVDKKWLEKPSWTNPEAHGAVAEMTFEPQGLKLEKFSKKWLWWNVQETSGHWKKQSTMDGDGHVVSCSLFNKPVRWPKGPWINGFSMVYLSQRGI